ncbi:MAG: DegT/DnrJ/EryC1/StrS family aminotransferase, partial [Bacteriovoracia bacterium]
LRSLMNHGRDSIYISIDDDKNKSKEEMELIIQRRFSFVQMGYSYRVTEMEGALGLAEFEDHEQMMRKRWDNAQYFLQKLRPLEKHIQLPALREGAGHAFMMFPIVVRKDQKRGLVSYLESHGIETRDMLPLINQPFYKELLGVREEDFPVAKWVNESGFYFGCHQNITEIEREYIVDVFHSYFAQESVAQEKAALIVMSKGDGRAAQMMLDALPVASFQDLVFVEGGNDRADEEACTAFAKRGFRVVRGTPGRSEGKGELLRRAVATTECENVVVFGGDGADSPEDIPRLLIRLKQGHALVIASRFMPGGARESEKNALYRSVGNRFFSFLLSVLFNANVSDCNNLFRGFKKTAISKLNLHEGGENAMFEMTVKALQNGNQFSECPTLERKAIQARRRRNRVLSALSFARILFQHSGGRNRALPTGGNKQLPGATGPHK